MAIKLKSPGEYKRAISELRKYADGFTTADGYDLRQFKSAYDVPLTRSQMRRVREYFDVLQRHAGYKAVTYQHFKDDKKLREAQRAMGMPSRGSWRGVFVPQPDEEDAAKLVKRGRGKSANWVVEYQGADKVYVPFDRELFAQFGSEYVRALFAKLPKSYQYALTMGNQARERIAHGGNLSQLLREIEFFIGGYSQGLSPRTGAHYSEYVTGVWVYRGGQQRFNELKKETAATVQEKKKAQEEVKKLIRRERRELKDWEEYLRLRKKYG